MKVPSYEPQVDLKVPQVPNMPRVNIQSSAFGGETAAAMGEMGQSIAGTVQKFAERQIERERIEAEQTNESILLSTKDKIADRLYSDEEEDFEYKGNKFKRPKGILNQKGWQATDSASKFNEFYKTLRAEAISSVKDPEYQQKLDFKLRELYTQNYDDVIKHQATQWENDKKDTFKASVDRQIKDAYLISEPEKLKKAIFDAQGTQRELNSVLATAPEVSEAAVKDVASRVVGKSILGALERDITGENSYALLESVKDQIDAEQYDSIKKDIKKTSKAFQEENKEITKKRQYETEAKLALAFKNGDIGLRNISDVGDLTASGVIRPEFANALNKAKNGIGRIEDDEEYFVKTLNQLFESKNQENVSDVVVEVLNGFGSGNLSQRNMELLIDTASKFGLSKKHGTAGMFIDTWAKKLNLKKEDEAESLVKYLELTNSGKNEDEAVEIVKQEAYANQKVGRKNESQAKEDLIKNSKFIFEVSEFDKKKGLDGLYDTANQYLLRSGYEDKEAASIALNVRSSVNETMASEEIIDNVSEALAKNIPELGSTINEMRSSEMSSEEQNLSALAFSAAMSAGNEMSFIQKVGATAKREYYSADLDQMKYTAFESNDIFHKDKIKDLTIAFDKLRETNPIRANSVLGNAVLTAVGMAPAMGAGMLEGAGVGAVSAIGAAAVTGLGAPVSAPAALAVGSVVGSMNYWYRQGTGSIYMDLYIDNVKDEVSKPISAVAGSIYAGIEFSQVSKLIPGGSIAAKKILTNSVKKTIKRLVAKHGANWASEVLEEGLQEITISAAKDLATNADGKTNKTVEEIIKTAGTLGIRTMKDVALPMLILGGPSIATDVINTSRMSKGLPPDAGEPAKITDTPVEPEGRVKMGSMLGKTPDQGVAVETLQGDKNAEGNGTEVKETGDQAQGLVEGEKSGVRMGNDEQAGNAEKVRPEDFATAEEYAKSKILENFGDNRFANTDNFTNLNNALPIISKLKSKSNVPSSSVTTPSLDVEFTKSVRSIDTGLADSKDASNLTDTLARNPELLKVIDGNLKWVMNEAMTSLIGDSKVGDSVVSLIPIDMVNTLTGKKFSTKEILHNKTMLADSLSINRDKSIWVDIINGLISNKAFPATEWSNNLLQAAIRSAKNISTFSASGIHNENYGGKIADVKKKLESEWEAVQNGEENNKKLSSDEVMIRFGINKEGKPLSDTGRFSVVSSSGKIGQKSNETGLEGLRESTVNALIGFAEDNDVRFMLTGGTEEGIHDPTLEFTHKDGHKVDARNNENHPNNTKQQKEDIIKLNSVIKRLKNIGKRELDNAQGYEDSLRGIRFWEEGNHWDIEVIGKKQEKKQEKNKSKFSSESGQVIVPLPDVKDVQKNLKSAGQLYDNLLTPLSTRLADINLTLRDAFRKFEFQSRLNTHRYLKRLTPFYKGIDKMSSDDYKIFDLALKNRDSKVVNDLMKKYGLEDSWSEYEKIREEIYSEAKNLKMDIGYLHDYFPRVIKDFNGLMNFLIKKDAWGPISEQIREKEDELGRLMTDDEKADLVNKILRGYGNNKVILGTPSFFKERSIGKIGDDLNEFYDDSMSALHKYIVGMNSLIDAKHFFGIGGKEGDKSIGDFVRRLIDEGMISADQEKEVVDIVKTRFGSRGTNGIISLYKNIGYIYTMGSPISAITQIGDLGTSFYNAGVYRTLSSLGKKQIKVEDLGLKDVLSEEFLQNESKSAEFLKNVFRASGLSWMDKLGKETFINSELKKLRDQARKDDVNLKNSLDRIFGIDSERVLRDLKEGVNSDEVKFMLFSRLSDFQPLSELEMPSGYVKGGNARIFYMLKSYTLKQIDAYRNEVFRTMKDDPVKATANLVKLAIAMALMNAGADVIKNILLGRRFELSDLAFDNILRSFGFSKYAIYQSKKEGLGRAIWATMLPPVPFFDDLYRELARKKKRDLKDWKIWNAIPLVGKFYYWWFGGGTILKEK